MTRNGKLVFKNEISRIQDLEEIFRKDPDFAVHCIAMGWDLIQAKAKWFYKLEHRIQELKESIRILKVRSENKKNKE